MNSDAILRELNRLANNREIPSRFRAVVTQAIQHIKLQDEDLLKFKDDITDMQLKNRED